MSTPPAPDPEPGHPAGLPAERPPGPGPAASPAEPPLLHRVRDFLLGHPERPDESADGTG